MKKPNIGENSFFCLWSIRANFQWRRRRKRKETKRKARYFL